MISGARCGAAESRVRPFGKEAVASGQRRVVRNSWAATRVETRLENSGEKFDHAFGQVVFLQFNLLLHRVVRVRKSLQRIPFQFQLGSFGGCVLQIRAGIVRDSLAHGR